MNPNAKTCTLTQSVNPNPHLLKEIGLMTCCRVNPNHFPGPARVHTPATLSRNTAAMARSSQVLDAPLAWGRSQPGGRTRVSAEKGISSTSRKFAHGAYIPGDSSTLPISLPPWQCRSAAASLLFPMRSEEKNPSLPHCQVTELPPTATFQAVSDSNSVRMYGS